MKSTINIILRFSALLLLCILLAFLSFLAYYFYTGIDWGYPGGEISFVGLSKEDVAKKVGIGAVIFNDLYNSRIKDEIFDWDTMRNFNGETGPYLQYTYVRTNSILSKVGDIPQLSDIDINILNDDASINLTKTLYSFGDAIKQAADKNEPYIIARYLINLAQLFSSFYNENKIINEEASVQAARVYLTYCVNLVLKRGASLLGIQMPERM